MVKNVKHHVTLIASFLGLLVVLFNYRLTFLADFVSSSLLQYLINIFLRVVSFLESGFNKSSYASGQLNCRSFVADSVWILPFTSLAKKKLNELVCFGLPSFNDAKFEQLIDKIVLVVQLGSREQGRVLILGNSEITHSNLLTLGYIVNTIIHSIEWLSLVVAHVKIYKWLQFRKEFAYLVCNATAGFAVP